MEYCEYESIGSYLKMGHRLEESEIRIIASYCLLGLNYLHSQNIIHGVSAYEYILWNRISSQAIYSSVRMV